nr:DMT family transporter [Leifsonia psychrotolerans]
MALVAQIWASPLSGLGVIVGLLAAVCLAVYFLVGERQVASTSPLAVLFWSMLFASAFWFFFSAWWQFDPMLLVSRTSLGGSLESVSLPLWLLLLWNGLIGSFMPYLLSYLALATLSATGAGIVSTSEVIFAFAFAYLWLSESLDVIQMLGVLIVLTGIVLAQTARAGQTLDLDLARRDPPVTKQH